MSKREILSFKQLQVLEQVDESGEAIKDFVKIFYKTYFEQTKKMKEKLKKFDYEEVSTIAHNFKSSCGYIGATFMTEICSNLEKIKKSPSPEKVSKALADLEEEFENVKVELEIYLKKFK